MKAFLHHLAYDFKSVLRERSKLLMYYLFPLAVFLLMAGLMTAVNPFFKETMVPGMILFAVMSATLLTLPGALVGGRESGVLRSYRVNGVPAGSLLAIPSVGALVHMAVVSVIIAVVGVGVFGAAAPGRPAGFVAAWLLSYAAYAGLGALMGAAAPNQNASTLLAQLVYLPSILLGGLMMPASVLPEGMRRVALLTPASHAMNLFASWGGMAGAGGPWASAAVLAGSAALSFGLAGWIFQWDPRAQTPNRRSWAALLAVVPYAAAAVLGV